MYHWRRRKLCMSNVASVNLKDHLVLHISAGWKERIMLIPVRIRKEAWFANNQIRNKKQLRTFNRASGAGHWSDNLPSAVRSKSLNNGITISFYLTYFDGAFLYAQKCLFCCQLQSRLLRTVGRSPDPGKCLGKDFYDLQIRKNLQKRELNRGAH